MEGLTRSRSSSRHSVSLDANSSLLTVEQHRLEHRSVHLDLLNQVLQTWRTGVLSNLSGLSVWTRGSHRFAVQAATVGSRPSFP